MPRIDLEANGLTFAAYDSGGPGQPVVFLHGFPDDAGSMLELMSRVRERGDYRCIAPYMRGYHPTAIPEVADYTVYQLSADVIEICQALDLDDVILVGHDWGAVAANGAVGLQPERFSKLVLLSVPPLSVFARNLLAHPAQFWRQWYVFFFQLPRLSERKVRADNFAFLEYLWRKWSPSWDIDLARLAEVKMTFRHPGVVEAALGYYRGLMWGALTDPHSWQRTVELAFRPIEVPTTMVSGLDDGCVATAMFDDPADAFAHDDWRLETIAGAGHFLPLEAPAQVAELICDI